MKNWLNYKKILTCTKGGEHYHYGEMTKESKSHRWSDFQKLPNFVKILVIKLEERCRIEEKSMSLSLMLLNFWDVHN